MAAGKERLGQVEVGHRPAIGLLENFGGPIVAAQEVECYTQPDHAGRGLLFLGLQLIDGIAHRWKFAWSLAMASRICFTSAGPKGTVHQNRLLDVEFRGGDHQLPTS